MDVLFAVQSHPKPPSKPEASSHVHSNSEARVSASRLRSKRWSVLPVTRLLAAKLMQVDRCVDDAGSHNERHCNCRERPNGHAPCRDLSRYSKIASHQCAPLVSEVGSNDINLRCKMVKLRSRALAGRRNIGKFLF